MTVLIAAIAALLCGCSDMTELGNRAVIQAIAVDYNGKYNVSALLFSSGGDKIDASQENAIKVTGSGKTLSEAIESISLADGKKLYMCETKLLILGSGFESENVMPALNSLYYDLRCSLNMPVCCAENAELLTDMRFSEGMTSAEKPLSMLENANELGVSPKTTLLDLLADNASGKTTLIPYFVPDKNGRGMTESGDTISLSGARSLKNGKLSDSFSKDQTISLMITRDEIKNLSLNFRVGNNEKTCTAYNITVQSAQTPNGTEYKVTAKFKNKNGGQLTDEEKSAALKELLKIVSSAGDDKLF